jgi:hypothetical protein
MTKEPTCLLIRPLVGAERAVLPEGAGPAKTSFCAVRRLLREADARLPVKPLHCNTPAYPSGVRFARSQRGSGDETVIVAFPPIGWVDQPAQVQPRKQPMLGRLL